MYQQENIDLETFINIGIITVHATVKDRISKICTFFNLLNFNLTNMHQSGGKSWTPNIYFFLTNAEALNLPNVDLFLLTSQQWYPKREDRLTENIAAAKNKNMMWNLA